MDKILHDSISLNSQNSDHRVCPELRKLAVHPQKVTTWQHDVTIMQIAGGLLLIQTTAYYSQENLVAHKLRGPQYRHPKIIIRILGTPQNVHLFLGTPRVSSWPLLQAVRKPRRCAPPVRNWLPLFTGRLRAKLSMSSGLRVWRCLVL